MSTGAYYYAKYLWRTRWPFAYSPILSRETHTDAGGLKKTARNMRAKKARSNGIAAYIK